MILNSIYKFNKAGNKRELCTAMASRKKGMRW